MTRAVVASRVAGAIGLAAGTNMLSVAMAPVSSDSATAVGIVLFAVYGPLSVFAIWILVRPRLPGLAGLFVSSGAAAAFERMVAPPTGGIRGWIGVVTFLACAVALALMVNQRGLFGDDKG